MLDIRRRDPGAGPLRVFGHLVVLVAAEFLQGKRAFFCVENSSDEFQTILLDPIFKTPSLWNDRLFIGFWWPLGRSYGH